MKLWLRAAVFVGLGAACTSGSTTEPAAPEAHAPPAKSDHEPVQARAAEAGPPALRRAIDATPEPAEPAATTGLLLLPISTDDITAPIKEQRSRKVYAQGSVAEDSVRAAVLRLYNELRAELETKANPTKHIYIFVYTTSRPASGIDWVARAASRTFGGAPLPAEPQEFSIKLPKSGPGAPSARENEIYDALFEAVLTSQDSEKVIYKRVAKRFGITPAELERIAETVGNSRM